MINLKFLKTQIFAFFSIMIFVLICIIIYKILGPEPPGYWNYVPFPSMSPKDLPDAISSQKTCYTNLTACNESGSCLACGEKFECVTVETDTQYIFNHIKVPKGKWCLPKKPNQSCGTYTGKWVWSSGACSDGSSQCWKCECLYPELYDGADCMVQKVCINHSKHAGDDQKNNILIGTSHGPDQYLGVEWNPNNAGDSTVLTVNPYTTTTGGKPWFKCQCSVNDVKPSYINLPGDPYSCHVDPCWEYSDYGVAGAMCTEDNCSCTCNGGVVAPDGSKFKNTCVHDNIVCNGGHFNINTNECVCDNPVNLVENCVSDNFSRGASFGPPLCQSDSDCISGKCDSTGWCKCKDSTNPLGSNCLSPCDGHTCENGSSCHIDTSQDRKYRCDCKLLPTSIKDCKRDKSSYVYQTYAGINCEKIMYTDGTYVAASGHPPDIAPCTITGLPAGATYNDLMAGKYCESGKIHEVSGGGLFESEILDVCGSG